MKLSKEKLISEKNEIVQEKVEPKFIQKCMENNVSSFYNFTTALYKGECLLFWLRGIIHTVTVCTVACTNGQGV